MQFIIKSVVAVLLVAPVATMAQTTFLPLESKEYIILERMEIKSRVDSVLNFSKTKPFSRKQMIQGALQADSSLNLTTVDQYNLQRLKLNNLEWIPGDHIEYASIKPIWKNFYKTPANMFEVHKKDFSLIINPFIYYQVSKERNNSQHLFLNRRGLNVRGKIADKIGFAASISDNQERDPLYVQRRVSEHQAVPGQGFYQDFKRTGYDYFDGRGYFTFNVTKYIDVAFGYDKHFIGNGYRSLFLSDFSNSALFLKLNTRIWKFNYQNLFMELHPAEPRAANVLFPKKYAAMHHLDVNVTKWLNIGVFEGVIFGRKNRFEFGYLNPVIFYRSAEQQNGSFDNSVAGLDFKANVANKFQFYGQLILDEFKLSELRAGNGWWANKFGYQLGAKYIDVFNIPNLDLQMELNRVRPFTYSHNDSVANYTHYNQPLAHPLGANFSELLGILRYQPKPKWMLEAKLMVYKQGLNIGAESFGNNPLLPNRPPHRLKDYGFEIGSGQVVNTTYGSLLVSYEFKEKLFLELSAMGRNYKVENNTGLSENTSVISAAFRWNINRREFVF
ncbi:MAG: hypothetical protein H0V30_09570 [Chitinophagaceae bacterium]|nr:hypothetical protein [Chitinophagaceae bacterium]